jgi:hypothetical protein
MVRLSRFFYQHIGGTVSHPPEDRQDDLFCSSLEQFIKLRHTPVRRTGRLIGMAEKRISSISAVKWSCGMNCRLTARH